MNKLVIVSYLNFLKLKNTSRKILSESDDFLVSISKEEYINLSDEDKKKLAGVALTDEKYNASIIETTNIEELSPKELKFYLKEIKPDIDVKMLGESFKEKHLKHSKPYCPKNILNKKYNSQKKGGR
ncbi:MAG: hypothetical protein IJ532_01245 [Alphaproteobacteria bacterium]|nr:hypothetical protein [Alphaproteobacteria bacterium]